MQLSKALAVEGIAITRLLTAILKLLGNVVKRPMADFTGLTLSDLAERISVITHRVSLLMIRSRCLRPRSQLLLCTLKPMCLA